jgi:alkanesulfonate monooxygenase SsuD/methylene tetrahydromethanopterin reductase-like flavin-dependent oxidoreductase (luciferase family)
MRIAIGAGDAARSWKDLTELATAAEALGFWAIALPDHPNQPGLETGTALAALSVSTSRITLWSNVLAVPYRPPSMLARTMASVDALSSGRLVLGLGAGRDEREFDAYGFGFDAMDRRSLRLAETIQIVRTLWTESPASFDGATWTIRDAVCEPKTVQRPHPPIWVGSLGGRRVLRDVVARYADGCNLALPFAPQRPPIAALVGDLRRASESIGRDPSTLTISANLIVTGSGVDPDALSRMGVDRDKVLPLDEQSRLVDRLASLEEEHGIRHVMLGLKSVTPRDDLPMLADVLSDVRTPVSTGA